VCGRVVAHQQGSSMHPYGERVDEGEVERSTSVGKKFASVSTVHPPRLFLQPPSTNTNALQRQRLYAAPACRSEVLHGVQGLDQGGSRGAGSATECTVRIVVTIVQLPRSTPPCGLRAISSHWQLARTTMESEDRRGERRGKGCGTDEVCRRMALLLYASRGPK
jgi:hypothetical protein